MPFSKDVLMGSGGQASGSSFYDHQIAHSLRFDRADGSYLSRTLGTPTDIDKGTFSLWFKISGSTGSDEMQLLHTSDGGGINWYFTNADVLSGSVASGGDAGSSAAAFRDTSSWYHLVIRVDTTESSNDDRVRVYKNGTQDTGYTASLSQNTDFKLNKSGNVLYIGHNTGASINFDGYMAEIIFADGQSYAPSQFGETKNGIWIPKNPSGTTFGNNGFHLKFGDSSSLGTDSSGNSNNFSATNIGADHQVIDTPTIGTG